MSYSLLRSLRVVEVALLAPDALGGHLADLGADVVKIEQPPLGDYIRAVGKVAIGSPTGPSAMHLNQNRGKRSVALDLKTEAGMEAALRLIERADVFIDGMRMGAMDRLGLGYDDVRKVQPAIVYCSLSGFGRSGAYSSLGSHGMTFDSYAGLLPPVRDEKGRVRVPKVFDPVGIKAGPLYAAIGTLAAVVRARATGEPALVEVAQADAAVAWNQAPLEDWMNGAFTRDLYSDESLYDAVRYSYYEAADGGLVFFQATEERFFKNFCNAVGRPDLIERFPGAAYDPAVGNDELRDELVEIFASRPLVEWMDLFIDANVVGGPGYDFEHLINDAHFKDRGLRYTSVDPDVGAVELIASPIKVEEEDFSAAPAPRMGEHTREVLSDTLGLSEAAIQSVMSASFASTERSR